MGRRGSIRESRRPCLARLGLQYTQLAKRSWQEVHMKELEARQQGIMLINIRFPKYPSAGR